MARRLTGVKIRALRKQAGLTQAELARRAGISPSYLNLIECNRRPIAGVLLERISTELGVAPDKLDGEAERRMVADVEEIAAEPALEGGRGNAEDLVAHHPEWAAFLLRLHRAWHDRNEAVLALADRLNRDPFLGESVHRILTDVTSISSAAEILGEGDALGADARGRFLSIIASGGSRLASTAQSLLNFFDSAQYRVRSATPMEHVDTFIYQTDNYFPELEEIAARLLGRPDGAGTLREATGGDTDRSPFGRLRNRLAHVAGEAVDEIVASHPALPDEESRALAASALHRYAAAAVLMPYDEFLEAAEEHRYDIDTLSRLYGVSYEQTAHRMATLRRPGAEGVRFAFMRSDPSGYVTKRLPLSGLPLPRYGTACPLWVVYGAFQTPGVTARSFGELPSGERFFFFARAVEKGAAAVGRPRRLLSVMLACSAAEAGRLSAADGLDPAGGMLPVGTVCRLCPREACQHRQEAPLIAETAGRDERPMSAGHQAVI